jgi:PDDEXK-like domain of unknown function (DUF3799)
VNDPSEPYPLPVDGPGFYQMTAAEYHADPCPQPSLSASIAWLLCSDSAARARWCHPRLNPQHQEEESDGFDIGTAAHSIVLEGDQRAVRVVDGVTDWRTTQAKEVRDQLRAEGLVPLLRKHYDQVVAMTASTRAQLDAHEDGREMFRDGWPELVAIWRLELGDGREVWCRSRIDYLRVDGIDDYKSTRGSAHPEQVSKNMAKNGMVMQAEFYRRGVAVLTGELLPFRFAMQECYAPYLLSVNALAPSLAMLGEKQLQYALERWARCLEANVWPGYGTQTAYAELTPWDEQAWLDKEVRSAV